jgi:glycosyltransferase 2 family protein
LHTKNLIFILKIVWVLAVIAGALFYFINNFNDLQVYFETIDLQKLFSSFFLLVIFKVLTIDLVKNSLKSVGWYPDFLKAFSFVSISQMGKFIPGGIWQYVARFSSYKDNGLSVKKSTRAFINENIWLIFGSFLISIFFLFVSKPDAFLQQFNITLSSKVQYSIATLALSLWIMLLVLTEYYFRTNNAIFSIKKITWNFISQTSMWIVYGISFIALWNNPISSRDLFFCIGAFGLSFLAGYIAIFAPGGIGVREATAVLLFATLLLRSEIGVYALIHRFVYTLVDLIFAGIAIIFLRRQKTGKKTQELRIK